MRRLNFMIVAVLAYPAILCAAENTAPEAESPSVKVYLPREKVVEGPKITLDDIALVSGEEDLVRQARALPLGRAPLPGETLVLNRQTIRARLASENIPTEDVQMTGAPKISIRRNVNLITAVDMIKLGEAYLQAHLPEQGIGWKLACKPEPMSLPDSSGIKLTCRVDEKAPAGHIRVVISAMSGETILAAREMLFRITYRTQQAVATRLILPGEEITADNAKIETIEVEHRPPPWRPPFGAKAKKALQPGCVIRDQLIELPHPVCQVRRNQGVRIKLTGPGWCISTIGVAMDAGATDEIIRVRNSDSGKVIQARVDETGDVVPLVNGQ